MNGWFCDRLSHSAVADLDKIIAAVRCGHQALDLIPLSRQIFPGAHPRSFARRRETAIPVLREHVNLRVQGARTEPSMPDTSHKAHDGWPRRGRTVPHSSWCGQFDAGSQSHPVRNPPPSARGKVGASQTATIRVSPASAATSQIPTSSSARDVIDAASGASWLTVCADRADTRPLPNRGAFDDLAVIKQAPKKRPGACSALL